MILEGNLLKVSNPLNFLRRILTNQIVGKEISLGFIYYNGSVPLDTPYQEHPKDFEEVTPELVLFENRVWYNSRVEEFIRSKYNISDELAIQRQRDTKPDAFQEYFNFCEDCKIRAKKELGL